MLTPERFVWVQIDERRGTAVVTGKDCDGLVREADPAARRNSRGWVIRAERVADLCCLCDHLHIPFRERR
jgi:hypothetical protein